MRKIECISRGNHIYTKGEVIFQFRRELSGSTLAIVLDNDHKKLYVSQSLYEEIWKPRLRDHFPALYNDDQIYWEESEFDLEGRIVIYETDESVTDDKFMSRLSDNPDEEFPASEKEIRVKTFRKHIVEFADILSGFEKETLESILDKFDDLFHDLI